MHDAVGEVLAQRKALDRGAGVGIALSLVLHGAVTAAAVFAALRHPVEQTVEVIQIRLAKPAPAVAAPAAVPAPKVPEDRLKPVPTEAVPAPVPQPKPQPVAKPVAASPFGKSTKKPTEQPSTPATTTNNQLPTTNAIPVGGTGAVVEGDCPWPRRRSASRRRSPPSNPAPQQPLRTTNYQLRTRSPWVGRVPSSKATSRGRVAVRQVDEEAHRATQHPSNHYEQPTTNYERDPRGWDGCRRRRRLPVHHLHRPHDHARRASLGSAGSRAGHDPRHQVRDRPRRHDPRRGRSRT